MSGHLPTCGPYCARSHCRAYVPENPANRCTKDALHGVRWCGHHAPPAVKG